MCVIETKPPLGSLIDVDIVDVIVVNKETELTIWSIALVSMIQGVYVWAKILPDILEKMWSWVVGKQPTWLAEFQKPFNTVMQ